MMQKKLTQMTIDHLTPPKARTTISDTLLPGFQLRYWKSKSGTIEGTYSIRFRSPVTRKQTRHTIGNISKWKLGEARERARDIFQDIDAGTDPQIEKQRKAEPEAGTFETVLDEFAVRYLKQERKEWEIAKRILERNLIDAHPTWQHRPITSITKGDVNAKIDKLMDEGKGVSANTLLTMIKLFFDFAVSRDYLTASPIINLKKPYKQKPRQHVISDDDLKAVWEGVEKMGYPFGPFYKVLLLTGQRRTETARMKWSAIDLEARTWTLEAADTKSERRHVCPLSESVVQILDNLPRFDSGYVFTSAWSKTCINGFAQAHKKAKKLSCVDGWTIHDLRRTMRTNLSKIGVQPHIAELVINHAVGGLRGVYDVYTYHKEKAEALERWAAHLQGIVEGTESEVVPIRKTR